MTYPVYQVPAGDVLPIFFSTYAGATGASITLTGLAVTDIEIYKDGGTTQRASDAGYTLLDTDGIDFDTITGIHGFSIDTGDNTDASFYTVGAWFHVVVSAVTVDAQTVNFIAAAFRIVPAESSAGVPKVDLSHWLGTAAATPTVAGVPEVDVTHFNGTAGTFASGIPAVNAVQISGDSTAADNIETAFDDTAGAVPWAGIVDQGTAQSATATTLVLRAAAAFANDELIGATIVITGGTGIGQSRVITGYVGATDTATVDTWSTTPSGTITYKIYGSAPLSASATPPTAAAIADAVWDEATAGHTTSGTFGEQLKTDVDAILADTDVIGATGAGLTSLASAANLSTLTGYVDTEVAAIKAKTDSLTFTVAGKVDANITHVIADPVVASSGKTTNWGGTA
jgi:hypothetical protein